MSDTNNYPGRLPRRTEELRALRRAQRQREADNATVARRLTELAADLEAAVQRATWSLTVKDAQDLHHYACRIEGNDVDDGMHVSGDHRPGPYAQMRQHPVT